MKRPLGLLIVIAWCLLRGLGGTWGAVVLASYAWQGFGKWSDVVLVFLVEGAMWLWLAFGLFIRWNLARSFALLWCATNIVWVTYGFLSVALSRWNELRYGGVFLATLVINGGIIVYLLRPSIATLFTVKLVGPSPG